MKKIILVILVVLVIGVVYFFATDQKPASNEGARSEVIEKELCSNLTNVKSIVVADNAIDIEFSPHGGFQVVGRKGAFGVVESFEYATKFTVANGDNIYWGDGDHATNYLTVNSIDGDNAKIIVKDEFYWDGETTGSTEVCVIQSEFFQD